MSNLGHLKIAYPNIPISDETRKIAYKKLISLCTTFEEIKSVYDLERWDDNLKDLAINKLIDLCVSFDEAKIIYPLIRYWGNSKDLVIMKIITYGQFQQVLDYLKHHFSNSVAHKQAERLMVQRFGERKTFMKNKSFLKEDIYFPNQENIYPHYTETT